MPLKMLPLLQLAHIRGIKKFILKVKKFIFAQTYILTTKA